MLKLKKGFTLIELLVVITIIGILATGASAVYTSQIQKARDSTRVSDTNALKWWVEQLFQDIWEYPEVNSAVAGFTPVCDWTNNDNTRIDCVVTKWYISKLPKDPKTKQPANWSALDYTYAVAPLDNVVRQQYEISYWVESGWNLTSKASNAVDNWNDANRVELWVVWAWLNTTVVTSWAAWTACTGQSSASPLLSTACKRPDTSSCRLISWTDPTFATDGSKSNAPSKAIWIGWACE